MSDYTGPVVFSEGVHYQATDEGHPDTTRPLRWIEGTTFRAASVDDPLHNDVHHISETAIAPGSE